MLRTKVSQILQRECDELYLGMSDKVEKLSAMGFTKEKVEQTLQECNGDENIALEKLLSK